MINSDIHMHSSFSTDSDSSMESMIQGAILKGLKNICFTEHLDFDYPSDQGEILFQVDFESYEKTLFELREKYASEINVLYGIEFGLMPHLAKRYQQVASSYSFDFIIGSSHLIPAPWYTPEITNDSSLFDQPGDPYEKYFWNGRTTEAICTKYFQSIIDNINAYDNFDSYGHIDYIIRYAPEKNSDYSYKKYASILDEVLKAIIDHNLALEVNTAGYKYRLGQPNPQSDILARYLELGGERITIGADGHKPEHIAYDFNQAENLLKALGFKHYTIYKQRKPINIDL